MILLNVNTIKLILQEYNWIWIYFNLVNDNIELILVIDLYIMNVLPVCFIIII